GGADAPLGPPARTPAGADRRPDRRRSSDGRSGGGVVPPPRTRLVVPQDSRCPAGKEEAPSALAAAAGRVGPPGSARPVYRAPGVSSSTAPEGTIPRVGGQGAPRRPRQPAGARGAPVDDLGSPGRAAVLARERRGRLRPRPGVAGRVPVHPRRVPVDGTRQAVARGG